MAASSLSSELSQDVFPWLKSLPLAPEYRPSPAEFEDPISYIFKIEKEACKYGICKIIPPLPPASKKTTISNLNRSLAARAAAQNGGACDTPTFTTRQQQIGFCPRKPRPVQRPVWQSGEQYTFQEFEAKAKAFERNYLKKCGKKSNPSALEIETLYWKATVDKPFSVEYANDMPGSAFITGSTTAAKRREGGDNGTVGETAWNMRRVSRAEGSLLKFMKEEIPGVTSPMLYIAMMFSWFAWHVEDHDLHSLNYSHLGAGKSWYGVPREAAVAFEEVVRVHGYGGELNPLVTFATLGEKTTVMSPEVFVKAGIPCCRLVQNPGEFVVTFPRAYHSGFSHGFNCGEAANIATPEWLRMAKDAAIRRAAINYPPMVSHFQLLYNLALALCSRVPTSLSTKPRSSRLKDKKRSEGERLTKELFVENVIQNNELLHSLRKGSLVVLLPRSSSDISVCSDLRVGSQLRTNKDIVKPEGLGSDSNMLSVSTGIKPVNGFVSVKAKFTSLCERNRNLLSSQDNERGCSNDANCLSDQRLFSCVTCGILCFDCVAIVQPREETARYLMSAACSFFNDWTVGSGIKSTGLTVTGWNAGASEPELHTKWTGKSKPDDLFDVPVQTTNYQIKMEDQGNEIDTDKKERKDGNALGLLASTYGDSSDSDEDQENPKIKDCSSEGEHHYDNTCLTPNVASDCAYEAFYQTIVKVRSDLTSSSSAPSCATEQTKFGKGSASVLNIDLPFVPRSDEDSSRMHVFCLEHAVEVEEQLQPIGGAYIMLLCHPEYPKIEAEAKLVAEELGFDHCWNDIEFRNVTREDEVKVQSALDSEEAMPGNSDWAVKLGVNLFYSSILSRSPLYSKQMPYNSVIYNAFGRSSPASSPEKSDVSGKRSARQKKFVAGKWCGKVWMSNQVHPFLIQHDPEEEQERNSHSLTILGEEIIERKPSNIQRNETTMVTRKYSRKRKTRAESVPIKKVKSFRAEDSVSEDTSDDHSYKQHWRACRNKEDSYLETEGAVSGDSSDQSSDQRLRSVCRRRRTMYSDNEDDPVSDDAPEGSSSYRKQKGSLRGKHVKDIESDDEVSNHSLGDEYLIGDYEVSDVSMENHNNSHNRHRRIHRRKRTKIYKDMGLYDSENDACQQRVNVPRRSKAHHTGFRSDFSHNPRKDDSYQKSLRIMRTRQRRKFEEEDEEYDSLDEDSCDKFKRACKSMPGKATALRKVKQETPRPMKETKGRTLKNAASMKMKQKEVERKSKQTGRKVNNALAERTNSIEDEDEQEAEEGEAALEYQCDLEGCAMSFASKQQLALHKRNICPVKGCCKKFFSHKYLVQHRRVHLDDRPLKCPWKGCKMTFKWAWARTEHIRVHTGERPYVCAEPGCGQTFRFVSDFSRHKRKTGHSVKKTKR